MPPVNCFSLAAEGLPPCYAAERGIEKNHAGVLDFSYVKMHLKTNKKMNL